MKEDVGSFRLWIRVWSHFLFFLVRPLEKSSMTVICQLLDEIINDCHLSATGWSNQWMLHISCCSAVWCDAKKLKLTFASNCTYCSDPTMHTPVCFGFGGKYIPPLIRRSVVWFPIPPRLHAKVSLSKVLRKTWTPRPPKWQPTTPHWWVKNRERILDNNNNHYIIYIICITIIIIAVVPCITNLMTILRMCHYANMSLCKHVIMQTFFSYCN